MQTPSSAVSIVAEYSLSDFHNLFGLIVVATRGLYHAFRQLSTLSDSWRFFFFD
jgi:hypothetical protein